MNRYTQLTPSQFNPLSLEEIMLVPSMKRKQHDDILAKQEFLRGELAKVDPLDVHLDEAVKLREEMNNKLTAQAEQLAKSGVDPNSQSQFLALNREYQNLTGPTGRIGQINNAKKVYYDNMNSYIKDAVENKKWSREKALENWQKNMHSKYTGYDDPTNKTNIINIGQYGAPDKVETMTELKKIKDILGDQVVSEIFNGGNYVRERADGNGYEVINKNGSRVVTSNDPNIQQALGLIQSRILDPQGDIRKSAEFEGKDINRLWQEYQFGAKAMLSNKISDDRSTNLSLDAVKNQADWDEQKAVGQLIENTSSFIPDQFAVNDYNKNKTELDKLLGIQKTGKLSKEDAIKLDQLQTFQKGVNENIKNDKTYQKLNTDMNSLISNSGLSKELQDKLKSAEFINTTAAGISGRNRTIYLGNKLTIVTPEELNKINKIQSTLNDNIKAKNKIANDITSKNSIMSVGYGMFPSTKKEETDYNVMNESFFSNLKDPEALRKYLTIETINVDGKNSKPSNNDKQNLADLYSKYGKNGKIVSFIPKGFNGKPEYIIEFETDGNTYNMDGFSKGKVGEGKIQMKVSFNRVKGNMLANVNGAALRYLSNKGEINPNTGLPIGNDLAKEAASNIYAYSTYNDIINDQSYQWQNDAQIKSKMHDVMTNSLKKDGFKSPFYGQPQEKYMEIFLDNFGDEFITK